MNTALLNVEVIMNHTKWVLSAILATLLCGLWAAIPLSGTEPQVTGDRPSRHEFNPMHLGDKWWWVTEDSYPGSPPDYHTREVYDSMSYGDNQYYQISDIVAISSWVRNEGDCTLILDLTNIDGDSLTTEIVNEDFSITSSFGSPSWVYHGGSWPLNQPWACYRTNEWTSTILGQERLARRFLYWRPDSADSFSAVGWVDGIGPVSEDNEWCSSYVYACRINGVVYGDTTLGVAVSDLVTNPRNTTSCTNYPNPFNSETAIHYRLSHDGDQGELVIFDLRGRVVCRQPIRGTGTYTWNCRDTHGASVATGVYLCRIATPGKDGVTRKILYMK
jgi:hypothetical protein